MFSDVKQPIIKVQFKETYMPNAVTRTCANMSQVDVIRMYDLNSSDIEWFKFVD